MIYKARAIILKRTNFNEADRLITIFSEKQGKLKVKAVGIRKINSRLSGNLELFCLSNLNLAEGRSLDIVTGAQIEKCYYSLRNDLRATHLANYFAEVVDKLTEEKDPHPEIFYLLDEVLENINNKNSALIVPYFEWKIISLLGYRPNLNTCLNEKRPPKENEKLFFSIEHGGIQCEEAPINNLKISPETIKILRLFLEHNIENVQKINIDSATINELKKIARLYLNAKSEKEFRSQRFV